MGLFDKFTKRAKNTSDQTPVVSAEDSHSIVDPHSIENAIIEKMDSVRLEDCIKVPFEVMAGLGVGFAQMVPSLRTVTQTMKIDGVGYIPINNLPGEALKAFRKSTPEIYAGSFSRDGSSVMAKFVKAGPQTITSTAIMPIDPALIIMAAMLVSIEKNLGNIQQTQQNILSFLEQDKQAEMQANLNILTDVLENYKHNWDNDQYKTNHHIKVLDIKQNAEKNIIFYQSQIASAIKQLPSIHVDQAVNSAVKKLAALFHNYRMALYLFAYSSFLEVMLLENFREEYLNQVANKVQDYNEHHQNQFSNCRDMIKTYSSASVEKQVLGGIASASKALGKLIASSPVLSKGPVDEWLQDSGDKLLKDNEAGAEKVASTFDGEAHIGSEMFIESIRSVETVCNQTTGLLFDDKAIYIVAA